MLQETVFYTRYEHGGDLVRVLGDGAGVREYHFQGRKYSSARKLLLDIHGGKDLHMTFDRYFRQGRHNVVRDGITILDMFVLSIPEAIKSKVEAGVVVVPPRHQTYTGVREDGLGINLEERGGEVAKLFFSGFGSELSRQGFDLDDVLQEVYKGLMIRNQGECPFDPSKSSFGHYVHMVARCVVANYQRKEGTRRDRESVGVSVFRDGEWVTADVSERVDKTICVDEENDLKEALESFSFLIEDQKVRPSLKEQAKEMASLLLSGYNQNDIQEILSLNKSQLRKTLSFLRTVGLLWKDDLQL